MKEEVSPPGAWTKDSEAVACKLCSKEFNIARRKHHCRQDDFWPEPSSYQMFLTPISISIVCCNRKFISGTVVGSFVTVAATTRCNFQAPQSRCVSVTTATPCWSTSNLKCSRLCQTALDCSRLLVQSGLTSICSRCILLKQAGGHKCVFVPFTVMVFIKYQNVI